MFHNPSPVMSDGTTTRDHGVTILIKSQLDSKLESSLRNMYKSCLKNTEKNINFDQYTLVFSRGDTPSGFLTFKPEGKMYKIENICAYKQKWDIVIQMISILQRIPSYQLPLLIGIDFTRCDYEEWVLRLASLGFTVARNDAHQFFMGYFPGAKPQNVDMILLEAEKIRSDRVSPNIQMMCEREKKTQEKPKQTFIERLFGIEKPATPSQIQKILASYPFNVIREVEKMSGERLIPVRKLGQGSYGLTVLFCKPDYGSCRAIKIQKVDARENPIENIEKEVGMQNKFAAKKLALPVEKVRALRTQKGDYVLIQMKLIDGTVGKELEKRMSEESLTHLYNDLKALINALCKNKLVHGDFHSENIGILPDGTLIPIDFGRSGFGCNKAVDYLQLLRSTLFNGVDPYNAQFLNPRFWLDYDHEYKKSLRTKDPLPEIPIRQKKDPDFVTEKFLDVLEKHMQKHGYKGW